MTPVALALIVGGLAILAVVWIMALGVVAFFGLLERLFQPFDFVENEEGC